MSRLRTGFLFNHAAAHQVAHSLPIAIAMARHHPAVDVQLLVAGGEAEQEVRRLWNEAGLTDRHAKITRLAPPSPVAAWTTRMSGNAVPADRLSILSRNLDHFRALDALVVPEKTSTLLKTRFGLDRLALIHTRHGAGDRAIGFDAASARFDLVLMSGEKIRDRLSDAGLLKPDGWAIVGYPKFDTVSTASREPLFDNDRPTVLYNPHPSPALSSWYAMGPAVLRWFAGQDRFNLVFAPHVMLFAKRWTVSLSPLGISRVPAVPEEAGNLDHVRIDLGSRRSVDMTYTNAADIYLGDASSQVYEFLRQPRPCIFANPRNHDWQGNPDFTHWTTGRVINSIETLADALDDAVIHPARHLETQKKLFSYSFDLGEKPSSHRAADAIVSWLNNLEHAQ
ncbi:hypothetical protein [Sphingomonas lacunae]|nr:hypothetical protein [Sphingomonas lacunae]